MNVATGVLPNFTTVAPVNLSPVRTSESPTLPLVGLNEETASSVMSKLQPPKIIPEYWGTSSKTNNFHVPPGSCR